MKKAFCLIVVLTVILGGATAVSAESMRQKSNFQLLEFRTRWGPVGVWVDNTIFKHWCIQHVTVHFSDFSYYQTNLAVDYKGAREAGRDMKGTIRAEFFWESNVTNSGWQPVNRLVKQWCSAVNLKGNYGSHTLRKTWGYHQRVTHGAGLPELMVCFNHSSQRQTLDYLCIQPEEIRSVYANEL